MFDKFNVDLRENEGFLSSITCIPIPEYGQSTAPLVSKMKKTLCEARVTNSCCKVGYMIKSSEVYINVKSMAASEPLGTFRF